MLSGCGRFNVSSGLIAFMQGGSRCGRVSTVGVSWFVGGAGIGRRSNDWRCHGRCVRGQLAVDVSSRDDGQQGGCVGSECNQAL